MYDVTCIRSAFQNHISPQHLKIKSMELVLQVVHMKIIEQMFKSIKALTHLFFLSSNYFLQILTIFV